MNSELDLRQSASSGKISAFAFQEKTVFVFVFFRSASALNALFLNIRQYDYIFLLTGAFLVLSRTQL